MGLRNKRREWQGFVGALGLIAGLGGYIGGLYSNALATFLMIAVIIGGTTLVNVLTDPPDRR